MECFKSCCQLSCPAQCCLHIVQVLQTAAHLFPAQSISTATAGVVWAHQGRRNFCTKIQSQHNASSSTCQVTAGHIHPVQMTKILPESCWNHQGLGQLHTHQITDRPHNTITCRTLKHGSAAGDSPNDFAQCTCAYVFFDHEHAFSYFRQPAV